MYSVKRKLDVKSLGEKCRAFKGLEKGLDVCEKYDVPCCEAKLYWDYKCIK